MMKELPNISKSLESEIMDVLIRASRFLFPPGNYWWYGAYIIMFVGLSLFGLYTSVIVMYLDQGQIIQTDTFVAVMPFATSHMQTPLSNAIISLLFNLYGYLMTAFGMFIFVSGVADSAMFIENNINKKEDDEL